jgi:hypothetical protein
MESLGLTPDRSSVLDWFCFLLPIAFYVFVTFLYLVLPLVLIPLSVDLTPFSLPFKLASFMD